MVLATIRPITRGWANYYRGTASSRVYASLDRYMWRLTYDGPATATPDEPKTSITSRYFGWCNQSRQDRWVFGDRDSGAYMPKFAWTKIVRHHWSGAGRHPMTLPRPAAGPNGAARARRRSTAAPSTCSAEQNGRCPLCGDLLLRADREPQSPQQWEQWHRTTRKAITRQHRHTQAGRPTGRHPSHARTLPPPGDRRTQGTSTSLYLKPPTGLARAVCVDEAHARFLGGRGAAMRPAYPATSSARISIRHLAYSLTVRWT